MKTRTVGCKCQHFPLFWRQGTGGGAGHYRLYGFPKVVQGVLECWVVPDRIDIRIGLDINDISRAIGNRLLQAVRGTSYIGVTQFCLL